MHYYLFLTGKIVHIEETKMENGVARGRDAKPPTDFLSSSELLDLEGRRKVITEGSTEDSQL